MPHTLNVNQLLFDSATRLIPKIFGAVMFLAGVCLLILVLTPIDPEVMPLLKRMIPLQIVEASHMLETAIAVLMILVARGLWERIDTAWYMAIALLISGAILSLTRELALIPAIILMVCAALLVPCKQAFNRPSQLLSLKLHPVWFWSLTLTFGLVIWGGFYAYKHVPYAHRLWGEFAYESSASRFLRDLVIMAVTVGVFFLYRLFGIAKAVAPLPDELDMTDLGPVIAQSQNPQAWLALMRDKHILWNEDRTAFVMYGASGKQWVVMGEPVGPAAAGVKLCWRLKEMASLANVKLSFYQVSPAMLPLVIDLGLTPYKIGEEAMVDVKSFDLAGKKGYGFRQTMRRFEALSARFEVIPAADIDQHLSRLRDVSDAWLKEKGVKEKRYSLGFFDDDYMRRTPVAVIRLEGRIMAFANLWPAGDLGTLSLDLMRYDPQSPQGIMEYLFLQLIFYTRNQGFTYFSLGMAPLSGLQAGPLSPLWSKLGSLIYTFGGEIYNFEGLRAYKDKFRPEWQPRYFAIAGREAALVPALMAVMALGGRSDKTSARGV